MILIPQPQKIELTAGTFSLRDTTLVMDTSCDSRVFELLKMLQKEIIDIAGFYCPITRSSICAERGAVYIRQVSGTVESYQIIINPQSIIITGNDYAGVFYAVQTLIQLIQQQGTDLMGLTIEDFPTFKYRGFMLDVTRGSIPTMKTLMELVDKLSYLKMNQLQLYIEHSFAFHGQSEIWTGQDAITAEEILTLDEYCKKKCVELIPCMQTFGHLYHALTSESYRSLCELEGHETKFSWCDRMHHHTLNVSDPNSFKFVKGMLDEFLPLFSSNKFNIGCDETFDLGKGKSSNLVKQIGVEKLYYDFFMQVYRYVHQQGKQVMLWGDMLLKYPSLLKDIPREAMILNWDYSSSPTADSVKILSQANLKQYVCPGVQAWNTLVPNFKVLKQNISNMIVYGMKYKAEGVLTTSWGDYGNINLLSASYPGIAYGAALSWNPKDPIEQEKNINDGLSFFLMGDKTCQISGLLEKLSGCGLVGWGDIVNWLERDSIQEFNWVSDAYQKRVDSWTQEAIKTAYESILDYGDKIAPLGYFIKDKTDFNEILVSIHGFALLQLVGQLVLKEKNLLDLQQWIVPPTKLAVSIDLWFNQYTQVWRMRNRESEICRLRNAILKISKIAHSFENL